jgi:hypothetical protein
MQQILLAGVRSNFATEPKEKRRFGQLLTAELVRGGQPRVGCGIGCERNDWRPPA